MITSRINWAQLSLVLVIVGLSAALVPNAAANSGGCLIISEVVMGAESGGQPRWIEITNTGTVDYTFAAGGIIVQMDDETNTVVDVDMSDVTIPAGTSFVVCSTYGGAGHGAYYGTYFSDPDMWTPVPFGIGDFGDDRYILTDAADGSNLLDIYGEFGVDGSGTIWEYTLGYSYRLPTVNSGNGGTFDPNGWFFGGVNSLVGGDPAAMLLAYTDPQRHYWNEDCLACPGDLNGDNMVNLADLAQLLSHYGVTSGATYEDGDMDGDGDVDLSDLAALLGVYGTSC